MSEFKRFFLFYNVCFLGTLCSSLIINVLYLLKIKLTYGLWWIGPFGFLPGGTYIALMVMSVIAWSVACVKTWIFTKGILELRIFCFLYLLISPTVVGFVFFLLIKLILLPNASKFSFALT